MCAPAEEIHRMDPGGLYCWEHQFQEEEEDTWGSALDPQPEMWKCPHVDVLQVSVQEGG